MVEDIQNHHLSNLIGEKDVHSAVQTQVFKMHLLLFGLRVVEVERTMVVLAVMVVLVAVAVNHKDPV